MACYAHDAVCAPILRKRESLSSLSPQCHGYQVLPVLSVHRVMYLKRRLWRATVSRRPYFASEGCSGALDLGNITGTGPSALECTLRHALRSLTGLQNTIQIAFGPSHVGQGHRISSNAQGHIFMLSFLQLLGKSPERLSKMSAAANGCCRCAEHV